MLKTFSYLIYLLVAMLGLSNFAWAQVIIIENKNQDLAVLQMHNVQIQTQNLSQLFSKLSLSYNIPIGFETSLNDDQIPAFIDFKEGTLSELMTQLVSRHNQYIWEINDGVVNVFPKYNYRDVAFKEILETEVSQLSVKERTSCRTLEILLANAPEIKKVIKANALSYQTREHGGFYSQQLGQAFRFDFSNMPLKSILNKIIGNSLTAKYWVIYKMDDRQVFSLGVAARHENSLGKAGKQVVPKVHF